MKIKVKVQGMEPGLLMQRLSPEILGEDGSVKPSDIDEEGNKISVEEQVKKKLYQHPNGDLFIPIANIQECIRRGGSITEGTSGADVSRNAYVLTPIELGSTKYEVFSIPGRRSGRNGAPYMIHRPLMRDWSGEFVIDLDQLRLDREKLKTAIEYAGKKMGFGSWRPGLGKGGGYGRFKVIGFEEMKNG